jgi:hypothetical protein
VAFKGPKETTHFNEDTGIMDFAPTHYSEIFEDVQVNPMGWGLVLSSSAASTACPP